MRLHAILLAILVAAHSASAQSPAASDKPTDLSGLIVAVPKPTPLSGLEVTVRKATEVSAITVTPSCRMPADFADWTDAHYDAPRRVGKKRAEQSAGTREFLKKDIWLIQNKDTRNWEALPGRASFGPHNLRDQFPQLRQQIKCLGQLKSITFLHVSEENLDDYELDFANGAIEWAIAPLDHGVIPELVHRYYAPQPATQQFNQLLKSIQRGHPDLESLTPELATALRTQWPLLQDKFKAWGKLRPDWGNLESAFFVRREDDGSYTYVVSFGRRKVGWNVLASANTGTIAALTYVDPTD